MVQVTLIPKRGNCHKYFPHAGHLGLSPVLVSGTIKVETTPDDEKNIGLSNVAHILVRLRCYEAVGGQAQVSRQFEQTHLPGNLNILWETVSTIWPPPDIPMNTPKCEMTPDNYQAAWKLMVPRSATDPNKLGFAIGSMTYKYWRSWWQLEAVVVRGPSDGEKSITKCYPLHLTNFRHFSTQGTLAHIHGSTRSPRINYSISCPAQISCGDQVTASLSLSTDHPGTSDSHRSRFKSVIVALERTVITSNKESAGRHDEGLPSTGTSAKDTTFSATPSSSTSLSEAVRKLRSTRSHGRLNLKTCLQPGLRSPPKPVVSVIQAVEVPICASSGQDIKATTRSAFAWNGQVDLTIPRPKSAYHYSIGDTCNTKFISVTYHLTAKVVIKTKSKERETISLGACGVELSCVPTLDRESASRIYNNKRHGLHFRKFPGPDSGSVTCTHDYQSPGLLCQSGDVIPITAMTL